MVETISERFEEEGRTQLYKYEIDDPATLQRGLPKWPCCLVMGEDITEDQAAEILIRCDWGLPHFSSNDREGEELFGALFGMPPSGKTPVDHWDREEHLRKQLNKVNLEYLSTSSILSAWIGGPVSWVSWDGKIHQTDRNIGKWPSCEEVLLEWCRLAHHFPFLDLKCQLLDRENCDEGRSEIIIEYTVKDGIVTVRGPVADEAPMTRPTEVTGSALIAVAFAPPAARERGITPEELKVKLEKLYDGKIPQYGEGLPPATKILKISRTVEVEAHWAVEVPEDADEEEVRKTVAQYVMDKSFGSRIPRLYQIRRQGSLGSPYKDNERFYRVVKQTGHAGERNGDGFLDYDKVKTAVEEKRAKDGK